MKYLRGISFCDFRKLDATGRLSNWRELVRFTVNRHEKGLTSDPFPHSVAVLSVHRQRERVQTGSPEVQIAVLRSADDMFPVGREAGADLAAAVRNALVLAGQRQVGQVVQTDARIVRRHQQLKKTAKRKEPFELEQNSISLISSKKRTLSPLVLSGCTASPVTL